jgi:hypothetical protein
VHGDLQFTRTHRVLSFASLSDISVCEALRVPAGIGQVPWLLMVMVVCEFSILSTLSVHLERKIASNRYSPTRLACDHRVKDFTYSLSLYLG